MTDGFVPADVGLDAPPAQLKRSANLYAYLSRIWISWLCCFSANRRLGPPVFICVSFLDPSPSLWCNTRLYHELIFKTEEIPLRWGRQFPSGPYRRDDWREMKRLIRWECGYRVISDGSRLLKWIAKDGVIYCCTYVHKSNPWLCVHLD